MRFFPDLPTDCGFPLHAIRRDGGAGRASRASFYRFDAEVVPSRDRDIDLRDALQLIALEMPSYGRPRLTGELRRRGWTGEPKRVYRLMREDNLLCGAGSSSSRPTPTTAAYLSELGAQDGADGRGTSSGRPDITYIRLWEEFVFLAVVLDAYSRRVIGRELDRTLEDKLTIAAPRMGLARRSISSGLVRHSDRGTQYASHDYTGLLEANQIHISMSRKRNLGQRGLRVLHEDAEVRGGPPQRVS